MNTTAIWSEKLRMGGKPCIRGQRFPMSQLLAEVCDGVTLREISDNFDIDYDNIKAAWIDLVNELCLLKINSKYIIREEVNCLKEVVHLRGDRIPVSLVLMDLLLDNSTPMEESAKRDLRPEQVEGMLNDLANLLSYDWTGGPPEKAILEGHT